MSHPPDPGANKSILTRVDLRAGRLTLNRPAALNALDLTMIRQLTDALTAWRSEPAIHLVMIEGAGGRAFCAGGDIRAIRQAALDRDTAGIHAFFAEEYALNQLIADYPKPYVALIDGICMGGGIGVSAHGSVRVATERAMFAMPETSIALFPDVGTSYILPRLPGALGFYLGLTGARITGGDAIHAGFATHFVPAHQLPELTAALAADGVAALARFAEPPPPFSLAAQRPAIDRCFSAGSVTEILTRLSGEGDWGAATTATLRAASPSALCWSFELLRQGANRDLTACLAAELALIGPVTAHLDFAEGVRAMVIDKDRTPHWSPASLEDVQPAAIASMFA